MDSGIFLKAKEGNKEAMGKIIKRFEPLIRKECSHIYLKDYDFEDLKQIAYIAVIKGVKSISEDQIDYAPAYIMKCIHNSLKYEARRTLRKPEQSSIEQKDSDGITLTDKLFSVDDTESSVLQSMDYDTLKSAFHTLSPKEKDILSYYIQNSYGGLRQYADVYAEDYRRIRYQKDKALRKMKIIMESYVN